MLIFLCSRTELYFFLKICFKNQNSLLKLKFRNQIRLNMQNSMVIFIFLVGKYPFCVHLIQKFKRVILRRNLVPSLECLIDLQMPPPPPPPCQLIFRFFFHPEHSFSTPPSHAHLLLAKVFNPILKQYTYGDFFAISQKE